MNARVRAVPTRVGVMRRREVLLAWIMLAPALVVVVGIVAFPVVYNLWLSFHSGGLGALGGKTAFVGWKNYTYTLNDPYFRSSVRVTVFYSVASALLVTLAGLAVALLLARPFLGRRWVRAVTLFPYVAPAVALAFVWRLVFDAGGAQLANWALTSTRLISAPIAWMSDRSTAIWIVIAFQVWRYFPFAMLLILARLQAVPTELIEAAQVDGAGPWGRLRYVLIPELRYVLAIVFVLRFVWTFNKFDDVFLLTGGAGGTSVLPVLIRNYVDGGLLPAAAACAVMLTLFLLLVVVFYQRKASRWAQE